jgi:uncharacterized membrane protein YdjX (TVP38/TMEM64 family)
MKVSKNIIIFIIVFSFVVLLSFHLKQWITLDKIKIEQLSLKELIQQYSLSSKIIFFFVYLLVAAFALPIDTILSLLGGALFGFWWGVTLVSFSSSIGACFAFLLSRFFLRNRLEVKLGTRLDKINQGLNNDGIFYLFMLRVIPVFPFSLVNILMGLSHIRLLNFYFITQVGMLFGTIIYINTGIQLSQVDSLKDIVSPGVLFSFAILGIFPLIFKKIFDLYRESKIKN